MVGGMKAISSAHSAKAGAQAAMEYARAAQAAVHPYIFDNYNLIPKDSEAASGTAGEESAAPVAEAKELVDSVVVLMQQLTNALESNGADCNKVKEILTYYQAQMGRYHNEGQSLAGKISEEDMNLIAQYAQTKVAAFASNLEGVVRTTASTCHMPISAFIPDASIGLEDGAAKAAPVEAKASTLTSELRGISAARRALAANRARKHLHAARMREVASKSIDSAVAKEQRRIKALRQQVKALKAEKARLHRA